MVLLPPYLPRGNLRLSVSIPSSYCSSLQLILIDQSKFLAQKVSLCLMWHFCRHNKTICSILKSGAVCVCPHPVALLSISSPLILIDQSNVLEVSLIIWRNRRHIKIISQSMTVCPHDHHPVALLHNCFSLIRTNSKL